MTSHLGVYSFKNVVFAIDGRTVTGFDDGDDVIAIDGNTSELGTPKIGVDGSAVVSISADESVKITFKLLSTSPFNKYLLQKVKRMSHGGAFPLLKVSFLDTSTGESGGSSEGVIIQKAKITHGKSDSTREWTIFCPTWVEDYVTYNA